MVASRSINTIIGLLYVISVISTFFRGGHSVISLQGRLVKENIFKSSLRIIIAPHMAIIKDSHSIRINLQNTICYTSKYFSRE